jgi:hypothetical protein
MSWTAMNGMELDELDVQRSWRDFHDPALSREAKVRTFANLLQDAGGTLGPSDYNCYYAMFNLVYGSRDVQQLCTAEEASQKNLANIASSEVPRRTNGARRTILGCTHRKYLVLRIKTLTGR